MTAAPAIFDRNLLKQRRRRAARLGAADFLLKHVAQDMAERLSVVSRTFPQALDLGTPADTLRRVLASINTIGAIVEAGTDTIADEDRLPVAQSSLDLVVSGLSLQFVNDLPGTLAQIRRALKPDGLFMAAMLGGDTLTELRHAFAEAETIVEGGVSPRVAPFADVRALGGLLQRVGFALPVIDSDRLTVRYDTPLALMHDLRRMGATNILRERRRAPLRRETLTQMMQIYADNYSDADRRVRATFEFVWLSGWAPHASQQQPLKPGSAKTRLADALGTREIGSGEKPDG
jgi:SAM-dependent methyltransferase